MANNSNSRKQIKLVEAYQVLFKSSPGQAVLEDLMKVHYMDKSTFDKDPAIMAIREGERNVVLRIFHLLKIDMKQLRERIETNDLPENDIA